MYGLRNRVNTYLLLKNIVIGVEVVYLGNIKQEMVRWSSM